MCTLVCSRVKLTGPIKHTRGLCGGAAGASLVDKKMSSDETGVKPSDASDVKVILDHDPKVDAVGTLTTEAERLVINEKKGTSTVSMMRLALSDHPPESPDRITQPVKISHCPVPGESETLEPWASGGGGSATTPFVNQIFEFADVEELDLTEKFKEALRISGPDMLRKDLAWIKETYGKDAWRTVKNFNARAYASWVLWRACAS